MFAKGKGQQMPSDLQAKEKLAHYVYEYLMHLGAKQSAQIFLQEIRWEKNVALGEAPGFLSSWWCVFWDLYCAAPERRGQYEASDEAKIFHDYSVNSQPPPPTGNPMMMPGGQPQFARFHPNQRVMKMPPNVDYNHVQNPSANPANPSQAPSNPPSSNPNPQMNFESARVNSSMSPMSRLTPPGGRGGMPPQQQQPGGNPQQQQQPGGNPQQQQQPGGNPQQQQQPGGNPQQQQQPGGNPQQQNTNNNIGGYNGPPQVRGPNPNAQSNNAPMSPMPMNIQQQQQQQQRWSGTNQNNSTGGPPSNITQPQLPPHTSTMNYSSSSPAPYASSQQQINPHAPGTPIAPSPGQDAGDLNFSLNKIVPSSIQFHDQSLGNIVPMGSEISHHSQINGEIMDSLKSSPITNISAGSRQHHDETGPITDLNPYNNFGDANLF